MFKSARFKLGLRLKYHVLTNSLATRLAVDITSCTPPATSVKVAVSQGSVGPAGAAPPLYSWFSSRIKHYRVGNGSVAG